MTVPTFEELFTPLTIDQLVDNSLSVAQDIGLPSTAWQPTSIGREVIYINATNGSLTSEAMGVIARGGLLDYAEGDWLTLLADQVYDVQRVDSTAADGQIQLNNSDPAPYNWLPGDVRVLNETQGKTYTNSTGGTAPGGGSVTLDFQADEPGTDSNLVSGDVLSMETTYTGVTPAYVEDLLGTDEQSDEELRELCRASNAKASPNGPPDAYDYFAKVSTYPDGTNVGVTRTRVVQGAGIVLLYIADADGSMTAPDIAQVQETINENAVPTGITCEVLSVVNNAITVDLTLTRSPDKTDSDADVSTAIQTTIADYFATVDPGGVVTNSFQGVFLSTLNDLVRNAAGANIVNAVFTSPATDTALANDEVPTLTWVAPTWQN